MFILDSHEMKSTMFAKATKVGTKIELWHKRIGHINLNKLKEMQSRGLVIGLLTFKDKEIEGVCEACEFGKQHQHLFPKERNVSKGLLDVVHSDVWGLAQTTTFGGCGYYVIFIDDLSRHTWIYPMRQKSEVFGHFQIFKSNVEKTTGRHVRCLGSNGGKEYFFDAFDENFRVDI